VVNTYIRRTHTQASHSYQFGSSSASTSKTKAYLLRVASGTSPSLGGPSVFLLEVHALGYGIDEGGQI
jgi:hypothetical protein